MKKIKTSVYTIFVELKNQDTHVLLVHGYTGAIDKVTKKVAHFLKENKTFDNDNKIISTETFNKLIQRGYITDKSPYEEKETVKKMAEIFHKRDKSVKNFMFLIAYDCNFRCPYCFENEVSSNGKGWTKRVFTKEFVDKAYDAFNEIEPNTNLHSKKIILYGGEPLLEKNKSIIEYIVDKGSALGYSFMAITNGYDLDYFEELLSQDKINQLQISIDGTEEKHNNRRTHYLYGESFQKIITNIEIALKKQINVFIRINTELNNFEDLKKIKDLFSEKGFYEYKNFSTYSALVHGEDEINCNTVMKSTTNKTVNNQIQNYDYQEDIYKQYIDFDYEEKLFSADMNIFHDESMNSDDSMKLMNRGKFINKYLEATKEDASMKLISCQDFGIRQKISTALKTKKAVEFRSVFCSAQTGEVIFDPYGDLYSCWETVGNKDYRIGTYLNNVSFDEEELNNWYGRNISTTPACSKCKYAFFCGGGCQAHALSEGRGYKSPYCDGYPKLFHEVVSDTFINFEPSVTKNNV